MEDRCRGTGIGVHRQQGVRHRGVGNSSDHHVAADHDDDVGACDHLAVEHDDHVGAFDHAGDHHYDAGPVVYRGVDHHDHGSNDNVARVDNVAVYHYCDDDPCDATGYRAGVGYPAL